MEFDSVSIVYIFIPYYTNSLMEWFIGEYHIWAVDEVDYSLFSIVVILH